MKVAIIMGSKSDLAIMEECSSILKQFGIVYDMRILSAHRTPDEVAAFSKNAKRDEYSIIIAGAGMAAHLAGVISAHTTLPVIGVPLDASLQGIDALFSMVQMPPGVPVACMAIDKAGATNAGIFAAQVLAVGDKALARKLAQFKRDQVRKVVAKDQALKRD